MDLKDAIELYLQRHDRFWRTSLAIVPLIIALAVFSRIPTAVVNSPLSWFTTSVSVSFLPVLGPFAVFLLANFLHAQLLHLCELRTALLGHQPFRKELDDLHHVLLGVGPQVSSWRRKLEATGFGLWLFIVPILGYTVLCSTFLDLARPEKPGVDIMSPFEDPSVCLPDGGVKESARMYSGRMQLVDAFTGIGAFKKSWREANGPLIHFKPLAPSVQANLRRAACRQLRAGGKEAAADLWQQSTQIPWIYQPVQAWLYFFMLILLGRSSWRSWNMHLAALKETPSVPHEGNTPARNDRPDEDQPLIHSTAHNSFSGDE